MAVESVEQMKKKYCKLDETRAKHMHVIKVI
jgi:hypothetical protein